MKLSRYFLQSHNAKEMLLGVQGPCKHIRLSVKTPEGLKPRSNGEPTANKTFQRQNFSLEYFSS